MPPELAIQPFEPSLLPDCAALYRRVFSQPPWNDQWESDALVDQYLHNHTRFNSFLGYVLLLEGRIIGASFGFLKPWMDHYEYYINEYYIDNSEQGKGYGSQFLRLIEATLRVYPDYPVTSLLLFTDQHFPAYTFYTNNGFRCLSSMRVLVKSIPDQ